MIFSQFRRSTFTVLIALALGVCAWAEQQLSSPQARRHSLPALSRVDRAVLRPLQDEEETTPPIQVNLSDSPAETSGPVNLGGDSRNDSTPTQPQPSDPIKIESQYAWRWEEDDQVVLFIRGQCRVTQGPVALEADEMVLWGGAIESTKEERLEVYLEGGARLQESGRVVTKPSLLVELVTQSRISCQKKPVSRSMAHSGTFQRGIARRRLDRHELQQTQYLEVAPGGPQLAFQDESSMMLGASTAPNLLPRRVTINPRNLGTEFKVHSDVDRTKQPPESMTTIQGGVSIIVDNIPVTINQQIVYTRLDLAADRAVIWTSAEGLGNPGGGFELDENTPFEVFLEGDIVVRQGNSEARASHAYYNIRNQRGLLMNTELRTYLPEYDTTLRVRADTIRQLSNTSFQAQNAWVSTSQMGRPGYRLQAGMITIDERTSFWGGKVDPATGQPTTSQYITSTANTLFLEEVPVFYLPRLSSPIEETPFPLESIAVGYSGMFGAELATVWSVDKLFGFDLPDGTDWDLLLDGYSQRGPAIGTRGHYDLYAQIFGLPSHVTGEGLAYYINDSGTDRLGLGRNNLDFPSEHRGRLLNRSRLEFPYGVTLSSELAYLFNDDRNFLEQYYESEWDRGKDQENLLNLAIQNDNVTAGIMFQTRLNDVFDQTEWLPRLDLNVLGEPLLGNLVTWSNHSWVGYGRIRPAQAPADPTDTFTPLPYFPEAEGLVAGTRHELSLPFQLGPVKVAPYALGEAAYWQQDMTADELGRLYGSAGVRASVEFWRAMPEIQSSILGLNGLAHKVVFDADYSYSRSSASLAEIPQYNAFDEDAQERFRERFLNLEFGGVLPAQFDPRFYAVRTGAGQSVTAAYQELVDNQQVLRLGMRHRWQTKDGPVERQRIIDWMSLDLETSVFPNADRDNFGETLGLLTGRYKWQVGERTQFLANAVVDPFHDGQRVWNAGVLTQRGPRGSLYLGYREVNAGPVESRLLTASFSYRMSEKWISTIGASYDVAEGRDRGQSLTITRIGEYLLFHVGTGYDRSRDNLSINFMVEPRLGGQSTMTQMSSLIGNGAY